MRFPCWAHICKRASCSAVCGGSGRAPHDRVLVATPVRKALPAAAPRPEAGGAALLALAAAQDRLATAPAAPAVGLCLVGVGYRPGL